jgi:hypothetical protein
MWVGVCDDEDKKRNEDPQHEIKSLVSVSRLVLPDRFTTNADRGRHMKK